MIDLSFIRSFFPSSIANDSRFHRYMLKEYLQLLILDHLAKTPYVGNLVFIGGTNLRLVQGIDRFSEDLDFDCKDLNEEEIHNMTDGIVRMLNKNGLTVETRDKLLFDLGLTGYKEERFLIKVEAQDQGVSYSPEVATLNRMGFFFGIQVPPADVLCAMKFCAILSRQKGRDFYDAMFLLSKTRPNLEFLRARTGIQSMEALKTAIGECLQKVDLNKKKQDFIHLLFNESNAERILQFESAISDL